MQSKFKKNKCEGGGAAMKGAIKEDVIQFIENMTVLELSEFIKTLEEKFEVTAAMPMILRA